LTTGAEFQALFRHGKRIDRPTLIVLWQDTEGPCRAGFAVSRQVRGAVHRNRAKRRLREAYRGARSAGAPPGSFVIIGRPSVLTAPFPTLVADLERAFAAISGTRRRR
jgi:ribonuclease P protein component